MKFKQLNGEITTIQYSEDGRVFNYGGEVYSPYKGCWSADVLDYGRITDNGDYFNTKKEAIDAVKNYIEKHSKKYTVSKCYSVITEESAADGDYAENGFVFQDEEMTLEEVIHEIERQGYSEWSCSQPCIGDWLSTVDADTNYSTGEDTFYSLHIRDMDEELFEAIRAIV